MISPSGAAFLLLGSESHIIMLKWFVQITLAISGPESPRRDFGIGFSAEAAGIGTVTFLVELAPNIAQADRESFSGLGGSADSGMISVNASWPPFAKSGRPRFPLVNSNRRVLNSPWRSVTHSLSCSAIWIRTHVQLQHISSKDCLPGSKDHILTPSGRNPPRIRQ